ncbi:MAG TPA: DUF1080 domain-containing protein [Lacunisphaera sp.]|nr:DUF1080 domain-containing protein [Lacunisphaera sp.]
MSRLLFPVILLSASLLPAAEPSAPLVKDTKPIALFNGHDLGGLEIFTEKPSGPGWLVEDGVLRCVSTAKGYLRTTKAYSDYHLRLEWRWPEKPGNSGVLINITGPDAVWPKCFECQLANGRAGDFAFFSDARAKEEIVSRNPSGVSTGRLSRSAAAGQVEKPAGEWNVYDIEVAGDTINLSVNGVPVNRVTGVMPSGGQIAFQSEGAHIDFRNIELTPLPAAKDLNAPMPK